MGSNLPLNPRLMKPYIVWLRLASFSQRCPRLVKDALVWSKMPRFGQTCQRLVKYANVMAASTLRGVKYVSYTALGLIKHNAGTLDPTKSFYP